MKKETEMANKFQLDELESTFAFISLPLSHEAVKLATKVKLKLSQFKLDDYSSLELHPDSF